MAAVFRQVQHLRENFIPVFDRVPEHSENTARHFGMVLNVVPGFDQFSIGENRTRGETPGWHQ